MIEKISLDSIWHSIEVGINFKFTYKKIDSKCIPDLNLGLDIDGNRCLVLLPPKFVPAGSGVITNIRRKNIELFSSDEGEIILLLKDQLHSELFTDLVFALYQEIHTVEVANCAPLLIKLVQDWLELFEAKERNGLGDDQVKGLIAELFVLERHLEKDQTSHVNDLIKSWIGPFDTAKDFSFDGKDIEVKFKNIKASKVRISSEFQLTCEPGKGLELWVVSGRFDSESGTNLSILNDSIKKLIVQRGGSMSNYLKSLRKIGINHETIKRYDHIKILLERLEAYDAVASSFPAIRKTSISDEVSMVSYNLNLTSLGAFKIFNESI